MAFIIHCKEGTKQKKRKKVYTKEQNGEKKFN